MDAVADFQLTRTSQEAPPPPRRVRANPTNRASTLAPRWIPKRGSVLRKVLKRVFMSCLCAQEDRPPAATNPSAVFPS
jgi:hypothetical protein